MQVVTGRYESAKVVDVLDVVEDDQSVRCFARTEGVQAACDELLPSWFVARVDLQFFRQFDQGAFYGLRRNGIHPCNEAPVCVFAPLGESCGKLSLSTATHANQNCALLRRIGDQLV